jgi:anti-sigma B factor antagonist
VTDRHSGLRAVQPETLCPIPAESGTPRSIPDNVLAVRVRRKPKYVLVEVAGEVDIATVARLRERLWPLAASGRPLVADLDQVSFIDASGLGALACAARLAAEHGASLQVVCAQQQIRRLFRLTGLAGPISLVRTLAEALQVLAANPEGAPAETEAVAAQWSRPDPDVLREALAALRQLA